MKDVNWSGWKVNRGPFMPPSCSSPGYAWHVTICPHNDDSRHTQQRWQSPVRAGLLSCLNSEAMKANTFHRRCRIRKWKVGNVFCGLFDSLLEKSITFCCCAIFLSFVLSSVIYNKPSCLLKFKKEVNALSQAWWKTWTIKSLILCTKLLFTSLSKLL